jgi:hypothetical protein
MGNRVSDAPEQPAQVDWLGPLEGVLNITPQTAAVARGVLDPGGGSISIRGDVALESHMRNGAFVGAGVRANGGLANGRMHFGGNPYLTIQNPVSAIPAQHWVRRDGADHRNYQPGETSMGINGNNMGVTYRRTDEADYQPQIDNLRIMFNKALKSGMIDGYIEGVRAGDFNGWEGSTETSAGLNYSGKNFGARYDTRRYGDGTRSQSVGAEYNRGGFSAGISADQYENERPNVNAGIRYEVQF